MMNSTQFVFLCVVNLFALTIVSAVKSSGNDAGPSTSSDIISELFYAFEFKYNLIPITTNKLD